MKELQVWMNTIDQLDVLLPRCGRTLNVFYHELHGFQSKPRDGEVSIISHARCAETLCGIPTGLNVDYLASEAKVKQLRVLLENDWTTGNGEEPTSYPISVAIPALSLLCKDDGYSRIKSAEKIMASIPTIVGMIEKIQIKAYVKDFREAEPFRHSMFLFRLRRALWFVENYWLEELAAYKDREMTPDEFYRSELRATISSLDEYLESRLYYFIAMCGAIPNNEDDALQLGYLIFTLHEYARYANDVLIEAAINLVLETLFGEGRVPRYQVIFRNERLNISASPLEILSLFSRMRHVKRRFEVYWHSYNRAYEWLRTTERDGLFDHSDAPGWMAEPWRGVGRPEAWVNAGVVDFFIDYKRLLREACGARLLVDFGASSSMPRILWEDLMDFQGYKPELEEGFLEPIRIAIRQGRRLPKSSMILFGPPGTAKTSIAKAIAWSLHLPYVEILPHHFAEEGTDGVIRRARDVFRKLIVMKRCVVLFDEIDELVTSREEESQKIGRFITTSVLPWFQALRDRAELVFIVSTNSVKHFDPAVKRPGRFDYVLPIGPPDSRERKGLLSRFLMHEGVEEKLAEEVAGIVCERIFAVSRFAETPVSNHEIGGVSGSVKLGWPVTIGEMHYLAEHVAREIVIRGLVAGRLELAIEGIVQRTSENSLIGPPDWCAFLEDCGKYRYPPIFEIAEK